MHDEAADKGYTVLGEKVSSATTKVKAGVVPDAEELDALIVLSLRCLAEHGEEIPAKLLPELTAEQKEVLESLGTDFVSQLLVRRGSRSSKTTVDDQQRLDKGEGRGT